MTRPLSWITLAALASLPLAHGRGSGQVEVHTGTNPPQISPQEEQETLKETTRAALRAAPRLSKLGRIRGARVISDVRFTATPDVPYTLTGSFAFPQRTRIVLASAGGAYERYQLGATFFARDVITGTAQSTPSGVLSGPGRTDTQLDMALRRAVLFWPDAPEFTGKGTTYSAKIGDIGILLATVDEATGLPSRIRTFGSNGRAAAEMHSIKWGEAPDSSDKWGRRWPTSMTFAAGGADVWHETVTRAESEWRFTDAWFLPQDRVTAVMGSETAGQLRILPVPGAWVYRKPIEPKNPTDATLGATANKACAAWSSVRSIAAKAFGKGARFFVSPHVEVELDANDHAIALRYEVTAPKGTPPAGDLWSWRAPESAWSYPLEEARVATLGPDLGAALKPARDSIAAAQNAQLEEGAPGENETAFAEPRVIRFQVGEEALGDQKKAVAVGLFLTAPAVTAADREGAGEETPK